jgi:hypothetical protein
MQHRIEFLVEASRFGSQPIVTPVIDDIPLPSLVEGFERSKGYESRLDYGGLLCGGFNYGPLDRYFLGRPIEPEYWQSIGGIYLLGCAGCGDVGRWPLVAIVEASITNVVWSDFRQPHRPTRDYSGFGPFRFQRGLYETKLEKLMQDLTGIGET